MKYQWATLRLSKHTTQRNIACGLCAVLLLIALAQTIGLIFLGYLNHRPNLIERPLGLHTGFRLSSNTVSKNYLASLARFLLQLDLTVTPVNVAQQHALFLQHVAPAHYDRIKRQLAKINQRVKSQALSSVFYPQQVQVNAKALKVRISGQLRLQAGDAKPLRKIHHFMLTFKYRLGRLWLVELTEAKPT